MPTILAGLLYLAVAVVTVGRGALAHPTSVCACSASPDPGFYMWLLRWLPFALLHGLSPLFTHEIWSPVGLNLAASAPIPVVALVLWPITTLAGPLAAFNVIAVLAPALAAGTMFRLCARVTGRLGASLAGGYLFGFGSYELGQSLGHPNLTLVFLVPLAVELVLRRLAADVTRRRFTIALAALVVVQALISTEILFDMALFGAVAFGWALVFAGRPQRAAILQTIGETIVAGLAAAVILIPFLIQALQSVTGGNANLYSLDLANVVIPTPLTWIGSGTFRALSAHFEGGAFSETGGYLGIPAFVAFAAFAVGARTRVGARVLLATAVVVLVAALGSHLHVAGHAGVLLPWSLVSHLPLFRAVLPTRFTLILELIVALGIAIWLAGGAATPRRRVLQWVLVGLAIVLLWPNMTASWWKSQPVNPSFFATRAYRRYIRRGEDVLVLPFTYTGNSMYWQAETDFYFKMPAGYLPPNIPSGALFEPPYIALHLLAAHPSVLPALRGYLRRHDVRVIILTGSFVAGWRAVLTELAPRPAHVGGVYVFRVPPSVLCGGSSHSNRQRC